MVEETRARHFDLRLATQRSHALALAVDDRRRRDVHDAPSRAAKSKAPLGFLEIEEEGFVEAADFGDRFASHQEARADEGLDVDDGSAEAGLAFGAPPAANPISDHGVGATPNDRAGRPSSNERGPPRRSGIGVEGRRQIGEGLPRHDAIVVEHEDEPTCSPRVNPTI
jgi:hypothetical protein